MSDAFQSSSTVQYIESALQSAGQKAILIELASIAPWTAVWFVNPFVALLAGYFAEILVKYFDQGAFAVFISIRTGEQVSAFIKAEESGNQQSIDTAVDNLVHLGKT